MKKWLFIGVSVLILSSCSDKSIKVLPEVGFSGCLIGMKKSEISEKLLNDLKVNLVFDNEGILFAIMDLKDKKYLVESHNLGVGDLLKYDASSIAVSKSDQISLKQKFTTKGGGKLIPYKDGIIFELDEDGRITAFSVMPKDM